MMRSWEKQILGHVNKICNVKVNGELYRDILITNIDLERNHIIGRKYHGEGQFITFFNVQNIVISDTENRRPGKGEWDKIAEEVLVY